MKKYILATNSIRWNVCAACKWWHSIKYFYLFKKLSPLEHNWQLLRPSSMSGPSCASTTIESPCAAARTKTYVFRSYSLVKLWIKSTLTVFVILNVLELVCFQTAAKCFSHDTIVTQHQPWHMHCRDTVLSFWFRCHFSGFIRSGWNLHTMLRKAGRLTYTTLSISTTLLYTRVCVCYMMYWKPTEKMRTWLTWHAQLSSRSKLQKSLYVKYNFWPIVMILCGKEMKANDIIFQLDLRVILAQGPCSHA